MKLELDKFCLFVGYARSGSSVVGSIIDAHPNAVISHEYNILSSVIKDKLNRQELFDGIIAKSQNLNKKGRWSGGANGEVYNHNIEGQIKREDSIIHVIGDKKSGSATKILRALPNRPIEHRIDKVKRIITALEGKTELPCMFIHVMRNPYDIVAAQIQSRINFNFLSFLGGVKTMDVMRELYRDRWLDVYHEDLIANPAPEIIKINDFLGLAQNKSHLDFSAKHLDFEPKLRRFEIKWPPRLKQKIKNKIIGKSEAFSRYSFKI